MLKHAYITVGIPQYHGTGGQAIGKKSHNNAVGVQWINILTIINFRPIYENIK